METKTIILDEGYMYGLGAFETMLIRNSRAVFLNQHLERLNKALNILGIPKTIKDFDVSEYILRNKIENKVLKIIVSENNTIFALRDNVYSDDDYRKGFSIIISDIKRNESSPLTSIKSLNYADNILEKRRAKARGFDEPIFLNTRGEIAEGAASNIFFVKENKLYTPGLECGLVNGIVRMHFVNKYEVIEQRIFPDEIKDFEEIFITNSLLGVMPVVRFGDMRYKIGELTCHIRREYNSVI